MLIKPSGKPGPAQPDPIYSSRPDPIYSSALLLGVATLWVTLSIKTPDGAPGSTLLYLVILPIALLLPAIALGGAFVAWHGFRASTIRRQKVLVVPAAIAITLNVAAVALFVRWIAKLL